MFGWIGSVLNIVPSVFEWLNKREDSKVATARIDGDVEIAGTQAIASVAIARAGDLIDGIARAIILWSVSGWVASIFLYCVLKPYFPGFLKPVLAIPSNIEYIPYAVVGYLCIRVFR